MAPRCTPFVLALLLLSGCGRARRDAAADSMPPSSRAGQDAAVAGTASQWDPDAGSALLIAGDTPVSGVVTAPDSANATTQLGAIPRPASATLVGRGGAVQNADLQAPAPPFDACQPWTISAAPPPKPWSVGFIGGVVAPLPMDSAEAFPRADSTAFAAAATRLASALPNDSAGRFTALPFTVPSMWRFAIPQGPQVLVATLLRQINQEATPLEERTLIVAERPASDADFVTAYAERSHGNEETIESREILAAVLLGANHTPTI